MVSGVYQTGVQQMALPSIQELYDLSGKTALVTGGAVGIGAGIVKRLAEAGANVVVADLDLASAERTVQEVNSNGGGRALAVQADASNPDDVARVTQLAVDTFGSLDILVNNAGIFPPAPFLEADPDMVRKVLDVNVMGVFLHSQAAARRMVQQGNGGRIIHIASIDGFRPSGNLVHYDASKGAVIMMTKAMALELAEHGITVNAVAPGAVATPGTGMGGGETAPEELKAQIEGIQNAIPMRRWGRPDDIANAVLYLASAGTTYITGEVIVVDGGWLLT